MRSPSLTPLALMPNTSIMKDAKESMDQETCSICFRLSGGTELKTLANQSPVACVVCDKDIIDGKDGAVLCEGLCDGWFHRHYAGLSVTHFDALSVSLDPFLCAGCF